MSYKKPDGLLLSKPAKRTTAKSAFLKKLERAQQAEQEAAHILLQADETRADNVKRRVVTLSTAYSRRRDQK